MAELGAGPRLVRDILAVIPARGGSKGIPRKNLRLLGGRPMLAHAVLACVKATHVTRTVVSTDDAEIAEVGRRHGAEIVWRPAEISGDAASSELALLHTLDHLREAEGYVPDYLILVQCTTPLMLPEDIDGTIEALLREEAQTSIAVTPFHYFLWKSEGTGDSVGVNHDKRVRLLRQEREPQYRETGVATVMQTEGFVRGKFRYFGKTAMHVMPAERSMEIDDPIDLEIAEVFFRERLRQDRIGQLPCPIGAIVLDFDGVFTDNKVIVHQDGTESVVCDRGDGWGLGGLRKLGIPTIVLSTEPNPVVAARCRKVNLDCIHGLADKGAALRDWLAERDIGAESVVYLGNDLNDMDCLNLVGCPAAPSDAHPGVLPAVRLLLESKGGKGAIRELCDLIERRYTQRS